ncbi:MAG: class I SAM-dependent methyltransferase [Synechococcaceae cyanobacterium SM2_3_1]|nr:class I SAM-dependent methyltransferase [Synechococcaceae cyanobacterium SM2_3_1]
MIWKRFTQSGSPLSEWFLRHYPPGFVRKIWASIYPLLRDRVQGISLHYDISNDFYKLFLDRKYMFYTCADFLSDEESIEDAQENKANYILNLIDPLPGEKILDLGCGWGGMLKTIYGMTGDKENLKGYNLSVEQKRFIDENYGFDIELKDVITAEYEVSYWDKVYSIGCLEHTPKSKLVLLAKKLATAIKPEGKLVHHFFCQLDPIPPARLLVCGAELFPGVELSTFKDHLSAFQLAGLRILHCSVHDYRPTLAAWFDRLVENKESAIQLVGIQIYNKYLCYLAEAWRLFDDQDLLLFRFVLQRKESPYCWKSPLYTQMVNNRSLEQNGTFDKNIPDSQTTLQI